MSILKRTAIFVSVAALVLLAWGAVPVMAGQAQQPAQAEQSSSAEGNLVRVDPDAKLIVVKVGDAETQFTYTDQTEITGATGGVAGLATMENARVIVHFTEDPESKAKTATRIEVQPPA